MKIGIPIGKVNLAGKPVFLLRSPDDKTWVMQTYTTHTDASLRVVGAGDLSEGIAPVRKHAYMAALVSGVRSQYAAP